MADGNYKSLGCVLCNKPFKLQRKNSMYCSNACKVAVWKLKNGRVKYEYVQRFSVYWTGYCADCSVATGGRRKQSRCNHCRSLVDRVNSSARNLARAEKKHKSIALVVKCAGCDVKFCPLYGSSHMKLCVECKDTRKLLSMRASRLMRKMRQRSQTVERVDPYKVFERDKWRCQFCKRKTPVSERGTLHPSAPELDHIVPISKGGDHSYRNTQCLCIFCNAQKSDRTLGQLNMFGMYG